MNFFYRYRGWIKTVPCVLALALTVFSLSAQSWERSNAGRAVLLTFSYAPQLSVGELSDRFGLNFSAGVAADYITDNNWLLGLHGQLLFGNNVKEDVLAGLRTEAGAIIGNDRSPADIQLRQRGAYYGLRVGRLIGLAETNPRSGLRLDVGLGLLQHRIRFQEDPFRTVFPLTGEYYKGYDRLTNGLALYQFVGYQVIGKSNGVNLIAGFEFIEGFTQNRRSFNFDTRAADTESRLDIITGLRVGFTLPIYLGNAEDAYY